MLLRLVFERMCKGIVSADQSGTHQVHFSKLFLIVVYYNDIYRSLATQLQDLNTSFRNSQKDYLNRVQKLKEGGGGDDTFAFLDEKPAKATGGSVSRDVGISLNMWVCVCVLIYRSGYHIVG